LTSGAGGIAATGVGLAGAATTGAPLAPPDCVIDETTADGAVTTDDCVTPKMIGVGDGAAIATDATVSPQRAPSPDSVIAPSKPSTARW
jgi:hypothetical protein